MIMTCEQRFEEENKASEYLWEEHSKAERTIKAKTLS